jgi:nicotinamidase-related amidase
MPDTALMALDAQRHFLVGPDALPTAAIMVTRLATALEVARTNGRLVVFVQHDGQPGALDEPLTGGWELFFEPEEDDWVVRKTDFDVFESNPALAAELAAAGVATLVVVGMRSEYCVQESSIAAREAGFEVQVPSALHATHGGSRPMADIVSDVELVLTAAGVTIT